MENRVQIAIRLNISANMEYNESISTNIKRLIETRKKYAQALRGTCGKEEENIISCIGYINDNIKALLAI